MIDPCEITVTAAGDRAVVAVIAGEFDLHASPLVTAALRPYLGGHVTLDLAGVTFMDSSALQCLLQLHAEAERSEGRLTAGALSPAVRRVLELCAFDATLFST